MASITAELRNWWFDRLSNRYYGDIYCDEKRRWIDGKGIYTSYVMFINDCGDYYLVKTKNSLYKLYKNQKLGTTYAKESKFRDGEHRP